MEFKILLTKPRISNRIQIDNTVCSISLIDRNHTGYTGLPVGFPDIIILLTQ